MILAATQLDAAIISLAVGVVVFALIVALATTFGWLDR